jgi:death-on-curing protein
VTTDFLSLEDLLEIARGILGTVEVRDIGLLDSAAARPQASAFGEPAYPTFEEQAAALVHSLARNHPLVDGNKRLAWAGLRAFHLMNGRDLSYAVDDAEAFVLAVARGDLEVSDIVDWLRAHATEGSDQ